MPYLAVIKHFKQRWRLFWLTTEGEIMAQKVRKRASIIITARWYRDLPSVPGCNGYYEFVWRTGVKAKTETSLLFISSGLGGRSVFKR